MNLQNLTLTAGEDRTLNLTARNQAGVILNLTGATIVWRLSQVQGGAAVLEEAGAIVSATLGTYTVTLSDDETTTLSGPYIHQGIVTIAGITTLATQGQVNVGTLNQPVFF